MSDKADIIIIGAGVVGLAVASEVANKGRDVYVLEKNDTFGRETSSRNSEIIHAGIYYPQGTLKARLCVEGNHILYGLCERYGIPWLSSHLVETTAFSFRYKSKGGGYGDRSNDHQDDSL